MSNSNTKPDECVDDVLMMDSTMAPDAANAFEDVIEDEPPRNYLPDWLYDETLKNAKNDTLSVIEEQFWIDLIRKYLTPIDRDEEEEVLDPLLFLRFF